MEHAAKIRAARVSVGSNLLLVATKLGVGLYMGSVSVISEAVHSAIDLLAAVIAYFSVRKASQPADELHPYGHGKIENVSGTIEAVLIFAAALMIIYEAVEKIRGRGEIKALGAGAAVMAFSALLNFFVSRYLLRTARKYDSVALEADALHLQTDVYTSAGVFAGLLAIHLTGITLLDPLIAILVALLIIRAAWRLTREAFLNILDVKLPDQEMEILHRILDKYSGQYLEYHQLRTRKAGAERHIDMHLVVPFDATVEDGHRLAHDIAEEICRQLPNCHILIHVEPCDSCCERCQSLCCSSYERRKGSG